MIIYVQGEELFHEKIHTHMLAYVLGYNKYFTHAYISGRKEYRTLQVYVSVVDHEVNIFTCEKDWSRARPIAQHVGQFDLHTADPSWISHIPYGPLVCQK